MAARGGMTLVDCPRQMLAWTGSAHMKFGRTLHFAILQSGTVMPHMGMTVKMMPMSTDNDFFRTYCMAVINPHWHIASGSDLSYNLHRNRILIDIYHIDLRNLRGWGIFDIDIDFWRKIY